MSQPFATSSSTRGGVVVLAVSGDVDIESAPALAAHIVDSQADRVVVDLSDVAFLDSSGMGALVGAQRTLSERGGWVRVAGAQPHVSKIFAITRLTEVISVHDSVEDACG